MSTTNRAKTIGKLHTALKKHYTAVSAGSRPLLEHILYASLLQDATYEMADEGIAKCEQEFYDWNEVRVTTVTELSQVLAGLPDATKAAARLKGNLLEIFEEFFTFDIDHLKKENLGKAVAKFEKMSQMTPFVLSYAVQHGLGGHAIPIDYAAMVVMLATGVVDQSEASDGKVPGLERAIPKSKGAEFGSLLHQCGVALILDSDDETARAVLDATEKGSADRLDEWLHTKEAAKKRVKRRKTSERAAAKKAAELEASEPPAEVTKPKSKSGGKSKPAGPARPKAAPKLQKTKIKASSPVDAAAEKPVKPKSAAAKKSAAKTPKKPISAEAETPADDKTTDADTSSKTAKKSKSKSSITKSSAAKSPKTKADEVIKTPTSKTRKKVAAPKADDGANADDAAIDKKSAGKKASTKTSAKSDNRRLTKKKPK